MTSSPATESALTDHDWFQFRNLTCCKKCGIVQRRDGGNKPCKGIVNVELRQDEKDAFSDAWSAMQHSEDMALKSIRRKLSIHELRSFLMLVTPMILQGRPPVSSPVGLKLEIETLQRIVSKYSGTLHRPILLASERGIVASALRAAGHGVLALDVMHRLDDAEHMIGAAGPLLEAIAAKPSSELSE